MKKKGHVNSVNTRGFRAMLVSSCAFVFAIALCIAISFFGLSIESNAAGESIIPDVDYEPLTSAQESTFSATTYPFRIYWNSDTSDDSLEFQTATKTFENNTDGALKYIADNYNDVGNKAYIVMKSDATASSYYNNSCYIKSDIYLDMSYCKLTVGSTLFYSIAKGESYDYVTNYYIYSVSSYSDRGEIVCSTENPLFQAGIWGETYTKADGSENKPYKTMHYTFENIKFTPSSSSKNFLVDHIDNAFDTSASNDGKDNTTGAALPPSDGREAALDIVFNDCYFYLDKVTSPTALFNAKDTSVYVGDDHDDGDDTKDVANSLVTVTVNGGLIKTATVDFTLYDYNDEYHEKSWVRFGKFNGNYTHMRVVNSTAVPTALGTDAEGLDGKSIYGENKLSFSYSVEHEENGKPVIWYYFTEPVLTEYGYVAQTVYRDNSFIVFNTGSDATDQTAYEKAYNLYSKTNDTGDESAFGYVYGKMYHPNEQDVNYTILMTKDYEFAYNTFDNFAYLRGTATLDLGGFTFTHLSTSRLFNLQAKSSNGTAEGTDQATGKYHKTSYSVRNGTIETESNALIGIGAYGNVYPAQDSIKTFELNFDKVNFAYTADSTVAHLLFEYIEDTSGDPIMNGKDMQADINFTDCSFDISRAPSDRFILFDAKDPVVWSDSNTAASTVDSIVNITVNGGSVTSSKAINLFYVGQENDTLGSTVTMDKGSDGEFLTVTLPEGMQRPSAAFHLIFDSETGKAQKGNYYNLVEAGQKLDKNQTEDYSFPVTAAVGSTVTYKFEPPVETAFTKVDGTQGKAPVMAYHSSDTENFPFLVFDSSGYTVGAYSMWGSATGRLGVFSSADSKEVGATLVVRRDFTIGERNSADGEETGHNGSVSSLRGSALIDLGGFTATRIFVDHPTGSTVDYSAAGYFLDWYHNANNDGASASVRVINGSIENNGIDICTASGSSRTNGIICINVSSTATAKTNFDVQFDNVKFSANEYANSLLFTFWENAYDEAANTDKLNADEIGCETNAVFNNCSFTTANENSAVFNMGKVVNNEYTVYQQYVAADVQVTVNGGSVNSANQTLFLGDPQDSFTVGKYGGSYPTFTIPNTYECPTYYFDSASGLCLGNLNASGDMAIDGEYVDGSSLSFALESAGDTTDTYSVREAATTKYGTVPAYYYYDTESYPFLMFKDGVLKYAQTSFSLGVLDTAKTLANGESVINVLMTRDYDVSAGYDNVAYIAGELNFDLNGNTLGSRNDGSDKGFIVMNAKDPSCNTVIKFFNGSVKLNGSSGLADFATSDKGDGQTMELYFTKVNIGFAKDATVTEVVRTYEGSEANVLSTANLYFEDCDIDLYTNAPIATASPIVFIELAEDTLNNSCNVVIDGGNITIGDSAAYELFRINENDTVTLASTSGAYTTLTALGSGEEPEYCYEADGSYVGSELPDLGGDATAVSTDLLTYAKSSVSDDMTVYSLSAAKTTDYGEMLAYYANYPFAVFSSEGVHLSSFDHWVYAFRYARDLDGSTVLMNMDYDYEPILDENGEIKKDENGIEFKPYAQYQGNGVTINVDLGGYTFTKIPSKKSAYIIDAFFGAEAAEGFSAGTVFKNGTLADNGTNGLFCLNYHTEFTTNVEYNLTFDGITIEDMRTERLAGAPGDFIFTLWEDGLQLNAGAMSNPGNLTVNAVFNECTINALDTPFALYFHNNTSYSVTDVNVVLNGGIITSRTPGLYVKNSDDTVIFTNANDSGAFTVFEIKAGAGYPDNVVRAKNADSNDTYPAIFTKTGENLTEGRDIYTLSYSELIDNFGTKSSLTFMSELVLNLYVPMESELYSVEVDGNVHSRRTFPMLKTKDIDGKTYYVISVPLPAKEAARDLSVAVKLNIEGSLFTARYTVSALDYTAKILAGEYSETEKTLVKDMLAYVKSAYNYFGMTDAATVGAAIDDIIGADYDATLEQKTGTANIDGSYITGATLVLNSTPAVRFYVADGVKSENFIFTQGEGESRTVLSYVEGTDAESRRYLEISLYAYRMVSEIAYTYDDGTTQKSSGSYHINSYYGDASSLGGDSLLDLVEKFYIYCNSACAYKNQ